MDFSKALDLVKVPANAFLVVAISIGTILYLDTIGVQVFLGNERRYFVWALVLSATAGIGIHLLSFIRWILLGMRAAEDREIAFRTQRYLSEGVLSSWERKLLREYVESQEDSVDIDARDAPQYVKLVGAGVVHPYGKPATRYRLAPKLLGYLTANPSLVRLDAVEHQEILHVQSIRGRKR